MASADRRDWKGVNYRLSDSDTLQWAGGCT